MKRTVFALLAMVFLFSFTNAQAAKWWEKWNNYPNVPRITGEEIEQLMSTGELVAFVYAGYKTEKILCGSYYLPYTHVPPNASGSKVVLPFPKDAWILCY